MNRLLDIDPDCPEYSDDLHFQDDYIPPGTFDLSYGFECHGFVSIQCFYSAVCGLRIED